MISIVKDTTTALQDKCHLLAEAGVPLSVMFSDLQYILRVLLALAGDQKVGCQFDHTLSAVVDDVYAVQCAPYAVHRCRRRFAIFH